ncbi:MAG: hypothetical protein GVY14_04385 [Spirochaetes bacterium]|jgi:hypothetical protein|nr:hypothetical protein [Spirochaetota bacterium]
MNAVVDSILAQQREAGAWELSADTVRELLGIDHADFYRRIYEEAMRGNRMVDLSMTTARFRQENVGELVTLLELFEGSTAEQELEHAGIFFSHETRFEITSRLLRRAGEAAAAHTVDRSAFEAMLDRLGSYRRARGCYLDEYFSLAALIADTAREYVELAGYREPDLAAANVRDLLEQYFSRHVLERETVLAAVCIALFEIAVEVGAVRRPEDEWAEEERERRERDRRDREHFDGAGERRGAGERARGRGADPLRRAREVMELETDDDALSTSYLKAQYKALMKRYHPDVNPGGLRACQRINEAYSLLLASAADSP